VWLNVKVSGERKIKRNLRRAVQHVMRLFIKQIYHALAVLVLFLTVFQTTVLSAEQEWKTIDEGFTFKLPPEWKKKEVRGIDSHVGNYHGPAAYLEFDEVHGLGLTVSESLCESLNSKTKKPTRNC
jgi:hypothetical protein